MGCSKQSVARGRPRAFDPEKGVEIAAHMFRERGYDGVGVAELGQAIGINPPSFYSAYGSKKALLERVLVRYGSQNSCLTDLLTASGSSMSEKAGFLFLKAADSYTEDPSARGCLVMEGTRNCSDPEACALTSRAQSEFRKRIVAWIAEAAPDAAPELGDYVLLVLAGLSAQARAGAPREALITSARIAALGFSAEADRLGIN